MPRSVSARPRLRWVKETSAGGLVVNDSGIRPVGAVIGRQDRYGQIVWSIPKGHIEAGETVEDAAVREVAEETGITGRILGKLGTLSYWFVADRQRVHKNVYHYLMRAHRGELSATDVEVDEVAWVPLDELPALLAYHDEQALAERAPRLLADRA